MNSRQIECKCHGNLCALIEGFNGEFKTAALRRKRFTQMPDRKVTVLKTKKKKKKNNNKQLLQEKLIKRSSLQSKLRKEVTLETW